MKLLHKNTDQPLFCLNINGYCKPIWTAQLGRDLHAKTGAINLAPCSLIVCGETMLFTNWLAKVPTCGTTCRSYDTLDYIHHLQIQTDGPNKGHKIKNKSYSHFYHRNDVRSSIFVIQQQDITGCIAQMTQCFLNFTLTMMPDVELGNQMNTNNRYNLTLIVLVEPKSCLKSRFCRITPRYIASQNHLNPLEMIY